MSRSEQVLAFQRELRAVRNCGVLVVAHRGTKAGVLAENSPESAHVALLSGADVVEVDATATTDGVVLAHHDGTEAVGLGIDVNVKDLSASEVARHPVRATRVRGEAVRLGPLRAVAKVVRDRPALVHIDRAWQWWEPTFAELDPLGMPERIVVKAPVAPGLLEPVAAHRVPYPVIAIVRTWADVEAACAVEGLNLAGVEFIAPEPSHELAQPEAVRRAHDRGLSVLANAENLDGGPPLFAGLDDHASLFGNPVAAWGRLVRLGIDDIQTDFPWLLAAFLAGKWPHGDKR